MQQEEKLNLFIFNSNCCNRLAENSMKKFLVYGFIWLMCFLVIFIALDISISSISRKYISRNSVKYAGWTYVFDDTITYDLVICGNSRAMVQYNPKVLDSVLNTNSINLGIDGSAINRQVVKFNNYIKHHALPKLLIQNVDIFTMKKTVGFEKEQYYPYFYNRKFLREIDIDECFSFQEKYIPFWRYLGTYHIMNDLVADTIYKGYKFDSRSWDSSELDKITTIDVEIDNEMVERYRYFIENCKANAIQIVFVHAPYYHEVFDKCTNIDEYTNLWTNLSQEYNIQILDYTQDTICYKTDYFYNGTHLNKRGAELFSAKLAHDIDRLGLIKQ